MKIAVTGLRGIPGVMGGVETHCEELLPRVKRLAPEASITVFVRGPYVPIGEREHLGVRIVPIASPRSRSFEAIIATFNSRSEEHTSELQSLMRISYAVFCLKKKKTRK